MALLHSWQYGQHQLKSGYVGKRGDGMELSEDLVFIFEVGSLIDDFEIYLRKLKAYEELDTSRIMRIEAELDKFDVESSDKDAVALFYYTLANYQVFLRRIAENDFQLLKGISKYVSRYDNEDDFYRDNYVLRAGAYRQAIKEVPEDTKLNKAGISQFYVNFSNLLHEMGRIVESIELLNDGDKVVDGFPMAMGNLGIKHQALANCMTNESHNLSKAKFLFSKGVELLTHTLDNAKVETIPLETFDDFADWEARLEQTLFGFFRDIEEWNISEDVKEEYKQWAAKNNLSLNFINVAYSYGNIDDIHIPNMGLGYFRNDNNMEYYSWFNTIKQEYNMARYFLYQVTTDDRAIGNDVHESQRYNKLINTLDYPTIGYRAELLKTSLREAFGVLDKIGMMCCKFHKIDKPVKSIDFHRWYKEIEFGIALKSPFKPLYWLSKDLDMNTGEMKIYRQLRNYLEHRYIRILESYNVSMAEEFEDDNMFEYKVSYSDLYDMVVKTLKLVRSAIFYLVIGFNKEYTTTINMLEDDQIFIPLTVDTYDDEWKD